MMIATNLPAAKVFASEAAYQQIFAMSVRLAIASIAAFACSELLDILVYNRLRARMGSRKIWLRNGVANFLGTFIDSAVFMFVAFYGVFAHGFGANVMFLLGLILPYWLAKCVMVIAGTPLVYAGIRYLRSRKFDKIVEVKEEVYEN